MEDYEYETQERYVQNLWLFYKIKIVINNIILSVKLILEPFKYIKLYNLIIYLNFRIIAMHFFL